jgi:hypothetical protein
LSEVRQREPRLELPALTRTANGEDCTLRIFGVCNRDPATTTWAHSNEESHGKGKGLKSHDCFGAFACSACHDWYDRGRDPERHEAFRKARDRTLYVLFAKGKLKVVA